MSILQPEDLRSEGFAFACWARFRGPSRTGRLNAVIGPSGKGLGELIEENERLRAALEGLLDAWDFMHGGAPPAYNRILEQVAAARAALSGDSSAPEAPHEFEYDTTPKEFGGGGVCAKSGCGKEYNHSIHRMFRPSAPAPSNPDKADLVSMEPPCQT